MEDISGLSSSETSSGTDLSPECSSDYEAYEEPEVNDYDLLSREDSEEDEEKDDDPQSTEYLNTENMNVEDMNTPALSLPSYNDTTFFSETGTASNISPTKSPGPAEPVTGIPAKRRKMMKKHETSPKGNLRGSGSGSKVAKNKEKKFRLSIYQIDPFHLASRENTVELIVDIFEKAKQKSNKGSILFQPEDKASEELSQRILQANVDSPLSDSSNGNDFTALVFSRTVTRPVDVLLDLCVPKHTSSTDVLIFYYRSKPSSQIWVVTTGAARFILWSWINADLPRQIATHPGVFESTGSTETGEVNLISEVWYKEIKSKSNTPLQHSDYFMPVLFTTYRPIVAHAGLKKTVRYYTTGATEESDGKKKPGFRVMCSESEGSLKVLVNLPHRAFPPIFDHLSNILKSRQPDKLHKEYCIRLTKLNRRDAKALSVQNKLECRLLKILFKAYQDEDSEAARDVGSFVLSSNHFYQFLNATSYSVRYEGSIVDLDDGPSVLEILDMLKTQSEFRDTFACNTFEAFKQNFSNVFIRYLPSSHERFHKVLQYIQLTMRDPDSGLSYWKYNSDWYQVDDKYLSLIESKFREILRKHVLPQDVSQGALPKPWPNTKDREKLQQFTKVCSALRELKAAWEKELERLIKGHPKNVQSAKNNVDTIDDLEQKLNQLEGQLEKLSLDQFNKKLELAKNSLPKAPSTKKTKTSATTTVGDGEKKSLRTAVENYFNRKFRGVAGFGLGDKVLTSDKIEICDIFKVVTEPGKEKTVWFYHVKEGFGQHTAQLSSQIMNAAQTVFDGAHGNDLDSPLRKWYDGVPGLKQKFLSFPEFQDSCKRAIFVYGLVHVGEKSKEFTRSLKEEGDQLDDFTPENILRALTNYCHTMVVRDRKILKTFNNSDSLFQLSQQIIRRMEENLYVTTDKRIVTKLFWEHVKNNQFKLVSDEAINDDILEMLKQFIPKTEKDGFQLDAETVLTYLTTWAESKQPPYKRIMLGQTRVEDVAILVLEELRKNGYIDQDTSRAASKWIQVTQKNFQFQPEKCTDAAKKHIWRALTSSFSSTFESLPPKLECLNMYHGLQKFGFQFKIVEIPVRPIVKGTI